MAPIGTPAVTAFCGGCGSRLAGGALFCTGCGVRVPAPRSDPVDLPAPRSGAYDYFAPPAVRSPAGNPPPAPARRPDPLATLGDRVRDIPLHVLIPLGPWLRDGGWRRGRVGAFLLFAVAPFILLRATAGDREIYRIAWGFAVYFAALWMLALHALIRPERQRRWLLARVGGFTMVAGVGIAVAMEKVIKPDSSSLVQMVLGVGGPEELAKGLAVYLFVFHSRTLWSTRTFLFAGVVSGLAFGVAEAVTYSAAYASAAPYLGASTYTSVAIWRLLTDSLFHACMAGIAAFFIGLAAHHRRSAWTLIPVGLATAAVLHGAYDRYASSWGGTAIAALIIFIFAGYVRGGDSIADEYAATAP